MEYFIFFVSLLFTILIHEAGHLCSALLFKVKVKAFCIGFFKPYFHKEWKGIDWRITPFLFGGYCSIAGETDKEKDGLLIQPYYKKAIIICAGVFMNLLIALICYLINYKSISIGLMIDWVAIKSVFTNDYTQLINLVIFYKPNFFFLQLSMLNIFCFVTNLIPYCGLDGSYLWLYLMESAWKDKFISRLQFLTKWGFWSLMIIQVILILWICLK